MSQYRENSSFENSISAQNKKFLEENDKYDVCFVFPTEDVDSYSGGGSTSKTFTRKGAETALKIVQTFGRENVEMFLGESKSKIFLLLRSSLDRLKNYADLHDFQFLADPIGLKDRCDIGWAANEPEYGTPEIEKLHFDVDRPDIVKFSPFEHIYLKYEYEDAFASLYAIAREESTPFSDCKRVGIIHRILEEPEEDGGVGLHLNQLLNDGICKAIFAIHHPKKIQSLKSEWFNYANFFPWQQPTQLIREYFGEAISLYYLFTGFFSKWLAVPAIVGLAWEIVVATKQQLNYPIVPFYSLFIVIWGVVMLEYWKRTESYEALYAGMLNYAARERERAEFIGEEEVNLTGRKTLYYPEKKRRKLLLISYGLTFLLCLAVVGTTALIYYIRNIIAAASQTGNNNASTIASILNAVQIILYRYIFTEFLSTKLTDVENQRTESDYQDSMIAKSFIFNFINAYSSFFYLAFFAQTLSYVPYNGGDNYNNQLGQCGFSNCMEAVAVNLGIVLAIDITFGFIFKRIVPYCTSRRKRNQHQSASDIELQYRLIEYDTKSLIDDYMTMAILFGYMTMFIVALPGATFLVFFNVWLEVRADAWTLLTQTRRPWPNGAQNIGTWQDVLDLVILAAVITNAAMISFTMQLLNNYSQYTRYWIFIGFQWVVFAIQFLIRAAIPDEPYDVAIQRQRQEFINSKIIEKEGDEDVTALMAKMKDTFPNIREYTKAEIDRLNLNTMIKNRIDEE